MSTNPNKINISEKNKKGSKEGINILNQAANPLLALLIVRVGFFIIFIIKKDKASKINKFE
ncbi:MAG TPA: hypothetical protein VK031_01860 [Tissierellaceae bacterium]|nr:hypothetical protein [Tissierellaceae bacterium]